jgi:hypothetical protein
MDKAKLREFLKAVYMENNIFVETAERYTTRGYHFPYVGEYGSRWIGTST